MSKERIRFSTAVPVRRDRWPLRRGRPRAARAMLIEQHDWADLVLRRLSAGEVAVGEIQPGSRRQETVVVFADGTSLLLRHQGGKDGRLGDGALFPARFQKLLLFN